jgi:hypothetical protein
VQRETEQNPRFFSQTGEFFAPDGTLILQSKIKRNNGGTEPPPVSSPGVYLFIVARRFMNMQRHADRII